MDEIEEETAVDDLDLKWVQGEISTDVYFTTVHQLVVEQGHREFVKAVGPRVADAL